MTSPVSDITAFKQYCNSLTKYSRRKTIEVDIGGVKLGGNHPIRVQSMTTIDTMDTEGSIAQAMRMVDAGCEYVRITAPSKKEAENLKNIKEGLRKRGYDVPLIADIHFTPNAAEIAARIVEKVRVNPGNYADKKKFENIRYTKETYNAELERIREKFSPLVKICKEYGTAMRIGTNHGSLSDRIMSRYGDTPLGMVESALEFLRICEDLDFYNIVLSMKASNTRVMVQAYRLLVQKLDEEGLKPYPLHLGVTEAGEAEDGRIKSAVGIGTLLEDGLGDTVRVSLTEEPEEEVPVARDLVNRYKKRGTHTPIAPLEQVPLDPYSYARRHSREVLNIGGENVPRVITEVRDLKIAEHRDLSCTGHIYLPAIDKFRMHDYGTDYVYTGKNPIPFMLPNGLKEILDYEAWQTVENKQDRFPLFDSSTFSVECEKHPTLNFVKLGIRDLTNDRKEILDREAHWVVLLETDNDHGMAEQRRAIFELMGSNLDVPVVLLREYRGITQEQFLSYSSTDLGGLLVDGMGDGVMLSYRPEGLTTVEEHKKNIHFVNSTSFGILQAARTRMTKTEYISCPSCGRTLFDLQQTTARIRKQTDHLKGVKIGIMGCIVNGPGEMADADYGYVGSGKGKITLYKGMNIVKRNVPSDAAVNELINIIKEDGKWIEPEKIAG